MDTQILIEEAKIISQKVVTKEIITDESMIVGGAEVNITEIISEEGIEYRRKTRFLADSSSSFLA
jgi:hypothetical protein